jgi:hypothetical protein
MFADEIGRFDEHCPEQAILVPVTQYAVTCANPCRESLAFSRHAVEISGKTDDLVRATCANDI